MSAFDKLYYKTCREQAGLTQEQAIALLGISEVATLSRYENGHTPVGQEMVAAMVRVYRTPTLAWWFVRYSNPDLAPFLMDAPPLVTDGDMMMQLEWSVDDVTTVRETLKIILRDGRVTPDEARDVKLNSEVLRAIASKFMAAAGYLDERVIEE